MNEKLLWVSEEKNQDTNWLLEKWIQMYYSLIKKIQLEHNTWKNSHEFVVKEMKIKAITNSPIKLTKIFKMWITNFTAFEIKLTLKHCWYIYIYIFFLLF